MKWSFDLLAKWSNIVKFFPPFRAFFESNKTVTTSNTISCRNIAEASYIGPIIVRHFILA